MLFSCFRLLSVTTLLSLATPLHATAAYTYNRALSNSSFVYTELANQPLITERSAIGLGRHLVVYNDNFSGFDFDLVLPGDQSEIREIDYAADGSWLVRMRVADQFDNYAPSQTVAAYFANGVLKWQRADHYETPIVTNASGHAQERSASNDCRIVQFDQNGNFAWKAQPANSADCEITSSASSPVMLLSWPQAGGVRVQSIQASDGTLGFASTIALATGEQLCGLEISASDFFAALCSATSTTIERRQLTDGTLVWRRSLARTAADTRVRMLLQPTRVMVSSASNEVDAIERTTGVLQWHRSLPGEVLKLRAFSTLPSAPVYALTFRCVGNDCPGAQLQSISATGALNYSTPLSTDSTNHFDLVQVGGTPTILATRNIGGYKLVSAEVDLQAGSLGTELDVVHGSSTETSRQIFTRAGQSSFQVALDPTFTSPAGGKNIRISRFRSVDGQFDWVRNYDLSTTEGAITQARVISFVANDQLVSFSVEAIVQAGAQFKRRVLVERFFASTGSRLKTLEFAPPVGSQQQYLPSIDIDGTSVWVGYDQFLSNPNGQCQRLTTKVALDASTNTLYGSECSGGVIDPMLALGSDVLILANGLARISANGTAAWNTALSSSFIQSLRLSADQQQVFVIGQLDSPTRIEVTALRTSNGALMWRQAFSSQTSQRLLYNSQVLLANGDLVISARNRGAFGTQAGLTTMLRLQASTGNVVWRVDGAPSAQLSESIFSLFEPSAGGPLFAIKRRSALANTRSFADWSSLFLTIDPSNGAVQSTWQIDHQNEDQSAFTENQVIGITGDAGLNALQLFRNYAPLVGGSDIGANSGLLLPATTSTGNLKITANALLSPDASSYRVTLVVQNQSAQAVQNARLGITYAGPGEWQAVQCLDASTICSDTVSPDRARFVMNLPANGTATFQINASRDPQAAPDLIRAHILAPFGLSETSLDDNDIELRIADQLLRSGFE